MRILWNPLSPSFTSFDITVIIFIIIISMIINKIIIIIIITTDRGPRWPKPWVWMSLPEITSASNSFQILSHQCYDHHHRHHHNHQHHQLWEIIATLSLNDFLLKTLLRSWPESSLSDHTDEIILTVRTMMSFMKTIMIFRHASVSSTYPCK